MGQYKEAGNSVWRLNNIEFSQMTFLEQK
jgi:hypothetical protein